MIITGAPDAIRTRLWFKMFDDRAIYECKVCKRAKKVDRDFSDTGRAVFCCGKIMKLIRAASVVKGAYARK